MKDLRVIEGGQFRMIGVKNLSRGLQASFSKKLIFRLNNEINIIRSSNCAPTEKARKWKMLNYNLLI